MVAKQQHAYHTLVTAVAMAAPSVRLVVVHVWVNDPADSEAGPADDHDFHQVVAVIAKLGQTYYKHGDPRGLHQAAPTHEAMESLGWRIGRLGSGVEYDALVFHPELGLCESAMVECSNGVVEIAEADWDPSEDESRLRHLLDELRDQAREKVARQQRNGASV
jgi:hypothetical protein